MTKHKIKKRTHISKYRLNNVLIFIECLLGLRVDVRRCPAPPLDALEFTYIIRNGFVDGIQKTCASGSTLTRLPTLNQVNSSFSLVIEIKQKNN